MSRNFKIKIILSLSLLLTFALAAGCGTALKESGGDQTGSGDGIAATAEYVGLDNCYTCHDQTKFNQWAKSRHANFDLEDGTRVDYATMLPAGSTTAVAYSVIGGDPHVTTYYTTGCAPCHMGPDNGGSVLEINYDSDVFTNPNIGTKNRFVISCEACHGGGSLHYGLGALPYPQPAFDQCTTCHAEVADDHHGLDGYRYWKNAAGENVGSSSNAAIASTVDGLTVWTLPLVSAWTGIYAGPYYFEGDRTINDTHYNEIWITNEDDKVTILAVSTAKLGYLDTSNSSPTSGMVNSTSNESCTASCHDPHVFDLTINNQWAAGAHRPIPAGPLSGTTPSAPANWGAVDHDFGSACLRCHSAAGFAELNGAFGNAVATSNAFGEAGAYITCNACHDGVNNVTAANMRLRLNGVANIFAYTGTSVALTVDAGPSATCIYCHQGRSTGLKVKDQYASALSTANFGSANSHYLAAAGILWKTSGYEYGTSPSDYNNKSYFEHDEIGINDTEGTGSSGPCVTCHMSGEPSNHYFDVVVGNALPTLCGTCHSGAYTMTQVILDDESTGFQEALNIIADELKAEGVFYLSSYPYFFNTSAGGYSNAFKAWTSEEQLGAAFNLNLLGHEPGAFAHNRYYAKRLIFDSIDFLNDGALGGTIGDYSGTYPNGAAWLGTARP